MPKSVAKNQTTYRNIDIDGEALEFSDGFTNLHTKSYEEILKDEGFYINDTEDCIKTVQNIRSLTPSLLNVTTTHPLI